MEKPCQEAVVLPDRQGSGDILLLSGAMPKLELFWPSTGKRVPLETGSDRGLRQMEWTDLDGDGNPELIGLSQSGKHLDVYRQNADNTLGLLGSTEVGPNVALRVGDLDGDKRAEAVLYNYGGNEISLWQLGESWEFDQISKIGAGEGPITEFGVLQGRKRKGSVYYSKTGVGHFWTWENALSNKSRVMQRELPRIFDRLESRDLDGNGVDDFVAFYDETDEISLLKNLEAKGFVELKTWEGLSSNARSKIERVNNDKWPDLVLELPNGPGIGIALGKKRGFEEPRFFGGTVWGATSLVGDIDGDGRKDLLGLKADGLEINLATSDGRYGWLENVPVAEKISDLVAGKPSDDGRPGIVASLVGTDTIEVFLNNGKGGLTLKSASRIGDFDIDMLGGGSLLLKDADGNGLDDLIFWEGLTGGGHFALGIGGGQWGDIEELSEDEVEIAIGKGSSSKPLLAVAKYSSFALWPLEAKPNLEEKPLFEIATDGSSKSILAVNLDQDPRDEFILTQSLGSGILVVDDWEGDGKTVLLNGKDNQNSLQAIDWNGDGLKDIVYSHDFEPGLTVHFQKQEGVFSEPSSVAIPYELRNLKVADLDRDGREELLGVRNMKGEIVVLSPNAGKPRMLRLPVEKYTAVFCLSDLNGDGWMDLVTGSQNNGGISVFLLGKDSVLPSSWENLEGLR